MQYVVEALDENGPVYREVGARTRRQVAEDLDVDLHGTVDDRRVDAGNTAFDDAVPRIHVHGLAKADVLGLRFGDAQLGHQLVRPCHPRDVRAGYHSLPGLDFQRLQHAFDACPDVEIGQEVLAHREVLFLLVYSRAGCPEPSVQRILQVLYALPFDVEAHLQLFGRKFNAPVIDCGDDALRRYLGEIPSQITQYINFSAPGAPSGGGTDHASFICAGAPGFNLGALGWDYSFTTWHTNRDTYDKVVIDDLKNNATLTAMLAYLASEDPNFMPRDRATITGRGVEHTVNFWLGEHGFGPYLDYLKEAANGGAQSS